MIKGQNSENTVVMLKLHSSFFKERLISFFLNDIYV